jgi:hypothetical protein
MRILLVWRSQRVLLVYPLSSFSTLSIGFFFSFIIVEIEVASSSKKGKLEFSLVIFFSGQSSDGARVEPTALC